MSRLLNGEERVLGEEPTFTSPVKDKNDIRLLLAYNWYAYYFNPDKALGWIRKYMKVNHYDEETINRFHNLPPNYLCAIARMTLRGTRLPKELTQRLDQFIRERSIKQPTIKPAGPVIKDKEKFVEVCGSIEALLDQFFIKYEYFEPNVFEILKGSNLKAGQLKQIQDYYSDLLTEIGLAKSKKIEGYNLSTKKLLNYEKFVQALIAGTVSFMRNERVPVVRKPRKKKARDNAQVVKHVQFLDFDKTLNLKSEAPINILASQSVWLYNVKYKRLTNLIAQNQQGLSIKGTTIINFNESQSITKTLRKPEIVTKQVITGTKPQLKHIFNDLTTKSGTPNGRLNADTIILRVLK